MTGWAFFLLVVAVCCLISGAYVINDYFDTKSDRISGIKKVVVGKALAGEWPYRYILYLTCLPFLSPFIWDLPWSLENRNPVPVGIRNPLVLFFYLQEIFFDGKFVGGYTGFFDSNQCYRLRNSLLNMAYAELLIETGTNFLYMFDWVFGFAWFIFLNTLMYEINKDIYTVEGDWENGNHTIPVKLGIRGGRRNYYRFSRCSYDFGCVICLSTTQGAQLTAPHPVLMARK